MARRDRRRAGPTLALPDALLDALERRGPLDAPERLARITRGVLALKAGLTADRAAFLRRRYLADAALREAYATYYLCANLPKLFPILDRLADHLPAQMRVLELGAGPGTGVAAVGLWARGRGRMVQHHATDAVPGNVTDALALAAELGLDGVTAATHDLAQGLPATAPVDVALFMNVVNELPPAGDARLVAELPGVLAPGGMVLVVEPAERQASRRALALRDRLVAAGWSIRAPCTHAAPCPALAAEDDWCHDEWAFERPAFMAAVDAKVGTRRQVLKATWFAATPASVVHAADLARVVSARRDEKGRSRVRICQHGALSWIERQHRDASDANADFGDASRFDLLRLAGEGTRRIGPADACERVVEGQVGPPA
ncbi:MAG: small ribosomal subunit Rsm22 family protein [bacterium]